MGITGKEFEKRLDSVHITVNKSAIPNDPEKPFVTSGVRVGTPAITSRGLGVEDMKTIAKLFGMVAKDYEGTADTVRAIVADLCKKYPLYR
jgi:glycine hydroxymethyltransferase